MSKQLQWAIGGLALLIVGSVALQIYLYVDKQRFKEEHTSPEPKTETESEQPSEQVQVPEVDNRPPPPDDGREYVWHGDHWDPVDSPHVQPAPVPKIYDGALTYHTELLETHPSEALALQSEERGHWSAKFLKGFFPADDHVAQELAKAAYLHIYYTHLRRTTGKIPISNEECQQISNNYFSQIDALDRFAHLPITNPGGRKHALLMLTWPLFSRSEFYVKDLGPIEIEEFNSH